MSKMGISTVASYRGSQLFEALGIDNSVSNLCFGSAVSRIKGAGFATIQSQLEQTAAKAWDAATLVDQGGSIKYSYQGEYHAFQSRCSR